MNAENHTNISSTDSRQGLTAAQVADSRRQHGDNVLTPPQEVSLWRLYLEKYEDPIIRILLVAAVASLVMAFVEGDYIETIGILLAVFIATTVGFYFERDAAKKFRLLTAINEDQPVKVRRDGKVTEVPRRDVVVGDVVLLEVGDEIPADGTLLEATNLQVDESTLTGEPLTDKLAMDDSAAPSSSAEASADPSSASAKEASTAYSAHQMLRSSMVMNGRGEMVVTAVGDATEIGHVAISSSEKTGTRSPLSLQLDSLGKFISKLGTGISVAAFLAFLIHDILTNSLWHTTDYMGMAHVVLGYFMMAVTLIVMAVPEGLPMAVTLSLALSMRRMLKSNNLVRKLHASETMGAATVICTDKTGTLTENKMSVSDWFAADGTTTGEICEAIAANSTAHLDDARGVGNPTEVALLKWVQDEGADYNELRDRADISRQLPFSTENKYMMTIVRGAQLYVKGAPEIVLAMCDVADDERQRILDRVGQYQQAGRRVLLLAKGEGDDFNTEGLHFQAVFAIEDPVRSDVPAAVADCLKAGIQVKVVTGDNSATAIEVARQIGVWEEITPIVNNADNADNANNADSATTGDTGDIDYSLKHHITGTEFAALTDEEAYDRVEDIVVMSRARPADKQRLVQLLQKHGEVVAVTGDGTNDAPALNYAHVGLSLGSGTAVAKQASDITLLDDSFHSITSAVMWGRSLYRNIQRFLFFQLVVNVTALLLVLGGAFIGTEMPLTVTQILWVNLIMDTFAAMALASLPPSREVLTERPRKQTDFILSRGIQRAILGWGLTFFLPLFALLIWCERRGAGSVIDIHELTVFFTIFVMLQWWNLLNAKCLGSRRSAFSGIGQDRGLLLVLVLILAGQWLIVTFGGRMFRTLPLPLDEWLIIIAATGVFVLGIGETLRWIKRMKR